MIVPSNSDIQSSFSKAYQITSKISQGGYGEILTAESLVTKAQVIIKFPKKCVSSAKASKEADIMNQIQNINGVPKLLETLLHENQKGLVIERLGKSMQEIIIENINFSLKTVIHIAVQLLQTIKGIHDKGIIHRDIKPSNILLGASKNSNEVFLIDYGLSTMYVANGVHKMQNLKKKNFKGTLMFASRNSHFGLTNSRRDDLESLGYTLVYLYKGYLPWSRCEKNVLAVRSLGQLKKKCYSNGVFSDLPKEIIDYFVYIDKLKYEETPDYEYLTKLFLDMAKHYDFTLNENQLEWSECSYKNQNNVSSNLSTENSTQAEEKGNEEINDSLPDQSFQQNLFFVRIKPEKFGLSKNNKIANLRNKFKATFLQN